MYNRTRNLLRGIIIASIGGFIGNAAYVCWDYATHPELYAMQSAPWYTSILTSAIVSASILIIALVPLIILGRLNKRPTHEKEDSHGKA